MKKLILLTFVFFSFFSLVYSSAFAQSLSEEQKRLYRINAQDYQLDTTCAGGTTTSPTQPKSGFSQIYILGDSITVGSASSIVEAFGEKDVSVKINASVSRSIERPGQTEGKKTSGLTAVDNDQAIIKESDGVIIALGTNSDGSASSYKQKMTDLINKVTSINSEARIFVVNLFSDVDHRTAYNDVLENLGSAPTVIDANEQSIPTQDKIHPTVEGQKIFASTLAGAISSGNTNQAPSVSNGCSCGPTQTTLDGADNEEKVWNFMISKGINQITAAGILGNLAEESSFDPHVQEIGKTPPNGGYGIVQWTGTGRPGDPAGARRKNLILFIEKQGVKVDHGTQMAAEPVDKEKLLQLQIEYMLDEGASIINDMKSIKDAGEAARYWMNQYERPLNRVQPAREAAARAALTKYGSGESQGTTGSSSSPSSCAPARPSAAGGTQKVTSDGYALPVKKEGVNLPCSQYTCHHDGTPAADLGITEAWEGTPVYAIVSGTIKNFGYRSGFGRLGPAPQECESFQLVGDDGWTYWYGHVRKTNVKNGERVQAGQQISEIGQSRCADDTPPHLHIDRGSPKGRNGGSECCRDPEFVPLLNRIYKET